jgi:hypothetical protein
VASGIDAIHGFPAPLIGAPVDAAEYAVESRKRRPRWQRIVEVYCRSLT